ncbi:ExbD/TolR family protein [Pyruvatibacter mobilis]|uniref:ExbD/TolR family protein n=1 Tax=Pyruvatibacter mobilis TaxID=1712261 RepID=UPI003BAAF783
MTQAFPPQPLASKLARRRSIISLTPLIDVVFILLVFFMLASSLQQYRSIPMGGPAETSGQPVLDELVVIIVHQDHVEIGGDSMPLTSALKRLAPAQQQSASPRILLQPAPGVSFQRAVTVLDELNTITRADVSLVNTAN